MTTTASTPDGLTDLEQKFVGEINERLEELQPQKDEYDRLTGTLNRLLGTNTGGGRGSSTRSASTAPRTRTTGRLEQFVTTVSEQPGITITEAAAKMGVQPNYLYRIRDRAKGEGKIRVEDGSLFPANNSARESELEEAGKKK